MAERIPVTIDADMAVLGLEPPETAVVLLAAGLVIIFLSMYLGFLCMFVFWYTLAKLKKHKPDGYVMHIWQRYMPAFFGGQEFPAGIYRP